ncbi:putative Guanine nucleotide-binding protein, partial [Naja naja]
SLQEVQLDKHIKLLDCPGIVMASPTSDASCHDSAKLHQDRTTGRPCESVEAILKRMQQAADYAAFQCARFSEHHGVLGVFGQATGQAEKGGMPDHEKAAKTVLNDWTRIGLIPGPVGISLEGSGLTSGAETEMAKEEEIHITEEEETKMEEDEGDELGPMTVELKSKSKTLAEAAKEVPRAPNLGRSRLGPSVPRARPPGSKQETSKASEASRQNRNKLSASLTAAMNFSLKDD